MSFLSRKVLIGHGDSSNAALAAAYALGDDNPSYTCVQQELALRSSLIFDTRLS